MALSKIVRFTVIFAALVISYYITLHVDAPNLQEKFNRQNSIIGNTIIHPYKYRVLNPLIIQTYYSVFKTVFSEKSAFLFSFALQNFVVLLFLFYSLSKYLSIWFDDIGVVIGLLIFAMLLPLALTWWDLLGDLTTAGLMALGFYFINNKRANLLFPILIIGAFNELQIILLILFYFFSKKENLSSKKVWLNVILMLLVFVTTYAVLYLLRGGTLQTDANIWTGRQDMMFNIHNPKFIIIWGIMVIPLLICGVKNFSSKPEFLRINILTVIPVFYILAFFILARMEEIDKALTIFLILIPMALYSLIPNHTKLLT